MSALATPRPGDDVVLTRPVRTFADRLLAATPLLSVYMWLCVVYVFEAWRHVTPWLFGDELELTQLSRSIADTGHAARRGVAHSPDTLYTYVMAPAWWLGSTHTSYMAIKCIGVLLMASSVFPTYFLARLVVGRKPALFAAAGAAAIPALAYSAWIVEEPLAYPYAALCFFLVAKALATMRVRWFAVAALACVIGPAVRGELLVLPAMMALACFFALWASPGWRKRRTTWSPGDWVGAIVLGFGAVFLISGYLSHHALEWQSVTNYWKSRILEMGLWALGAFAIGIGVVPLVAGIASLWRMPGERPTRELRAFRSVALGGFVVFGVYTGVKAAYLSTVFATRVEERNIIYIAPLLFVGTALWLELRRINAIALAAATGFALYLVVSTPFYMDRQLYSDALGLAILQQGNRYLLWTPWFAQWLLIAITAAGAIVLLGPNFIRANTRLAAGVAAMLGALVLGWNVTAEIAAAAGSNSISNQAGATLGQPYDWVDQITHRNPTLYLGQGVRDQNGEWLMEFWNRSIVTVSSLDGTVGGPGPAGGPNIAGDGATYWTLDPKDPGREYVYAVEEWPCVDFAGQLMAKHFYTAGGAPRAGRWRLVRLTQPNRLKAFCTGLTPDGWSGPTDSSYYRFSSSKGGHMVITVSREKWGGPQAISPVHVIVGTLATNENHQPELAHVTAEQTSTIGRLERKTFELPVPGPRFVARVIVDDKFVPHDLDPGVSDTRQLGAVVTYRFVPGPAPDAAHK